MKKLYEYKIAIKRSSVIAVNNDNKPQLPWLQQTFSIYVEQYELNDDGIIELGSEVLGYYGRMGAHDTGQTDEQILEEHKEAIQHAIHQLSKFNFMYSKVHDSADHGGVPETAIIE